MFNKNIRVLFFILLNSLLYSQSDIEDAVKYKLEFSRYSVNFNEVVTLVASVNIRDNFYIYSSHPEKSLSPTYIEWQDSSFFSKVGILIEPNPKIKYDPMFKMDIGYHTKHVEFSQNIKISNKMQPGIYSLNGTFVYQACDPKKCIPKWDDFSLDLNIVSGSANPLYVVPVATSFDSDINISSALGDELQELDALKEKGLLAFILFALAMGFLALLTPCVFPMIPITVSFFTKLGEKENSSPFFSAFVYAFGIIIIFTSLGLVLAFTLGAAGANQLAANPWINLFIAALFIYFAFSLFGHYEIQLPSVFRQFSSNQEQRGGVIGILFMALTFTLASFTCTVQFVGLLLVAASQGNYFWPGLGMLIFSAAFAFPFFFLALFPQYLAKLPKSGGWLNSIKVTMGFLELGAAMKFLSNSDLVWQWGIFTKQAVLAVWIIICFMLGFYLLGKIKLPHDSNLDFISVPRLIISLCAISFGLYLSAGLFGQPIHGLIDSYLPPIINVSEQSSKDSNIKSHESWINNFDDGINKAIEVDKPVFIDFTGYTCTNCRWMETNIFVNPKVKSLFNEFILVQLYTDGGENHRKNQQMEIDRFGTAALPFYVVLSPQNEEISRFHGMDTDVEKFINFLKNALNKYRETKNI